MKQYESSIEELFENYARSIFVTEDKRYIGSMPELELEYYDEGTNAIKWGDVEFIERHLVDKLMFEIILEDGNLVKVTEDHSLMVLRENKLVESKVYELKEEDLFVTLNGLTRCKTIVPMERKARWVYDIQMKDNPHTFFANGVLVHNSVFIKLKVDENTLKEQLE